MSRVISSARAVFDAEAGRYIINGLLATLVHYGVLTVALQVVGLSSAGLSNLIAACFGITASFFGSRYFVFKKIEEHIALQAWKFALLYASIACVHGMLLYAWTDVNQFDYRSGFLIATAFQVTLSYFGNKHLVFKS